MVEGPMDDVFEHALEDEEGTLGGGFAGRESCPVGSFPGNGTK
jgi:hypothetical protein